MWKSTKVNHAAPEWNCLYNLANAQGPSEDDGNALSQGPRGRIEISVEDLSFTVGMTEIPNNCSS